MTSNEIGARIDRLPVSNWHWQTFFLIGFGLQINGFLNSSGSSILADLAVKGWTTNYLSAIFSSAMMIGFFFGSLIGGALGDKIGRKKAYQISIAIFACFSLVAAFSPNMWFLIGCRALMGVGMGSGIVIGYASFTEFTPPNVRGTWSARLSLIGNFSPLIAALTSYLVIPIFGWRLMFVIGSAASLIALVFVTKYLDESPRWCVENNQVLRGIAIIERIETEIENTQGIELAIPEKPATAQKNEPSGTLSFTSFFRGHLGRRTLVATTVLIAMNVSLYTITVWIPTIFVNSGIDISKSLLMTTLIMLGAPAGVFVSTLIIDKFPRKWFGVVLIVAVAILGYVYSLQTNETVIVILGVSLVFVLYIYNSFSSAVYAPEIWPTKARLRGSGISNSIGRIVAICTPYGIAWLLTHQGVTAVFICLGIILGICALILAIFGLETRKKTVEEIGNLTKESRQTLSAVKN